MLQRIIVGALGGIGLLLLMGCWGGEPDTHSSDAVENSEQLHEPLLEIARTYESFGRLNTALLRWAPVYCRAPSPDTPTPALYSKSADADTHGQKLYSLFVKWKPDGFPGGSYVVKPLNPVGQVIVKETWVPEQVKDVKLEFLAGSKNPTFSCKREDGSTVSQEVKDGFLPYAQKGDRSYYAAKKGPLFIMMKLEPAAPGTDIGWVYGVVSADGKEVQGAGRIASCMGCHKDAPHDRLFGPPKE
jgi:hypothetical protein